MDRIITLFLAMVLSAISFAQTDLYFRINHHLGADPLVFNNAAQNNLGNDFYVDRMQYYISQIKVIYDGGKDTMFSDTWLLVDASGSTDVLLANMNISTIEEVQFSVGVNQSVNHLDPSAYPSGHPLAPKSPSMHWGWTAGYRFVAMEGAAGSSLNQNLEIHALGDQNYHTTTVSAPGKDTLGSHKVIDLYADYTMAIKDIDVSSGLVFHGEIYEAANLLLNFRDYVFSNQKPSGSVGIQSPVSADFSLSKNPISLHEELIISGTDAGNMNIRITDILGQEVGTYSISPGQRLNPEFTSSGIYFVSLYQAGQRLGTQKLVVAE